MFGTMGETIKKGSSLLSLVVFLSNPKNCRSNGLFYFPRRRGSKPDIWVRSSCARKIWKPWVDFFPARVDETSGACRSSEEPSIVHDADSDVEAMRRRKGRCGSGQ